MGYFKESCICSEKSEKQEPLTPKKEHYSGWKDYCLTHPTNSGRHPIDADGYLKESDINENDNENQDSDQNLESSQIFEVDCSIEEKNIFVFFESESIVFLEGTHHPFHIIGNDIFYAQLVRKEDEKNILKTFRLLEPIKIKTGICDEERIFDLEENTLFQASVFFSKVYENDNLD